jgi:DNA (cytosine-5)-methyltransferase 1
LDSNRFRAIGNAVCVPIVQWIGTRIVEVTKR